MRHQSRKMAYTTLKILSLLWLAGIILSVTICAFYYQMDISAEFDVNSITFSIGAILVIAGAACIAVAPYAIIEYNFFQED